MICANEELRDNPFDYDEEEDSFSCERCGDTCDEEDMIFFDELILCHTCADKNTFFCSECGERHWNDHAYTCNDDTVCEHCYDINFTSCDECGRVIRNDESNFRDSDEYLESPLCEQCYEDKVNNCIHDYYYKPQPIFYRTYEHSEECHFYHVFISAWSLK